MRDDTAGAPAGLATVAALVIGGSGVAVGAAIADGPRTPGRSHRGPDDPGRHPGPGLAGQLRGPGQLRGRGPRGAALGGADQHRRAGSAPAWCSTPRATSSPTPTSPGTPRVPGPGGRATPRRGRAQLVGTYPPDDLAVIRADDPAGLQPATFGDSDQAQAGDVVLAIGNPLGLSGSVTEGIISATGRAVTEPAAAARPAAHAARRDPDQRADQPGQQRRGPGQRRRRGHRHPDAGRGQPAGRRPGPGHRLRHPVQPGPRHRHGSSSTPGT